jgi:hypothetical protein
MDTGLQHQRKLQFPLSALISLKKFMPEFRLSRRIKDNTLAACFLLGMEQENGTSQNFYTCRI